MYDVCLSDYHGAGEGLLVIMRAVPASLVRHRGLVPVGWSIARVSQVAKKDLRGEESPRLRGENNHTNKLFDVYGSQSERVLRCQMQMTVRVRLMAGTEHRISLSV